MENELKRSNAELQQFAYIASHDLREPLRMVSSYLDLLESKYKGKALDAKAEEYIDFATEGAERMREMIDDLLRYSRIETRGKPLTMVDMERVLLTALNGSSSKGGRERSYGDLRRSSNGPSRSDTDGPSDGEPYR